MGGRSAIEWTDASWNPVTGCSKVSPGCAHCYAETFAERWRGIPGHPYENGFDLTLRPERLRQPLRWRTPRMVFVNSMSDLFHEGIPDDYIAEVYAVMAHAPLHTFQVLTKRPKRMRNLLASDDFQHEVARAWDRLTVRWAVEAMGVERVVDIDGFPGYLVTDRGRILRKGASDACLWCGDPLPTERVARSKFCAQQCNSKAHYEKRQGRWVPPEDVAREMSADVGEQGHMRVQLTAPDGRAQRLGVHRLVLTAFDRGPEDGEQGCHLDGDPSNNALPNLRWGSQSENWADRVRHGNHRTHRRADRADAWITPDLGFEWPLPNCWAGVSIENRRFVGRADLLRETPAAVRFISAEPLLGPLVHPAGLGRFHAGRWNRAAERELDLTGIDWLIVGGESGPGHRPMRVEWVRDLRDACLAKRAESATTAHSPDGSMGEWRLDRGTAFFFKQWGGPRPKSGGRELDGCTWDEFPSTERTLTHA